MHRKEYTWKEAAWKRSCLEKKLPGKKMPGKVAARKKLSGKEAVLNTSVGYRPLPDFWPLSDHARTT